MFFAGYRCICLALSIFAAISTLPVYGTTLGFQNLEQSDLSNMVGDVSTNFIHSSVSGASPLGHIFGFELGVVAGQTSVPHLQSLSQEADPSTNVAKLPDVALLGVLSLPLGITGEVGLIPNFGGSGLNVSSTSVAGKWTPTELFGDLPLSLAAKLSYTKTTLTFSDTVGSPAIDTSYNFQDSSTALTFLASKNFVIVEPYVGFGFVSSNGNLTATGSTTVFNQNFATGTSASASRTGTMWMVGAEVKLLVVKVGAEYTSLYGTNRVLGKISLFF